MSFDWNEWGRTPAQPSSQSPFQQGYESGRQAGHQEYASRAWYDRQRDLVDEREKLLAVMAKFELEYPKVGEPDTDLTLQTLEEVIKHFNWLLGEANRRIKEMEMQIHELDATVVHLQNQLDQLLPSGKSD